MWRDRSIRVHAAAPPAKRWGCLELSRNALTAAQARCTTRRWRTSDNDIQFLRVGRQAGVLMARVKPLAEAQGETQMQLSRFLSHNTVQKSACRRGVTEIRPGSRLGSGDPGRVTRHPEKACLLPRRRALSGMPTILDLAGSTTPISSCATRRRPERSGTVKSS